MIPHITFYTNRLPAGVNGAATGPIIRIRPQYRGDAGILAHELEHVRQWWILALITAPALFLIDPRLTGLCFAAHPILYLAVRRYRQWCEVRAYRVQMTHPDVSGVPLGIRSAAMRLMNARYKLNLSMEQALAALAWW